MSLLIKGINVKEIEHGAVAIINIDDVAYFIHGDDIVVISDHGDLVDRDKFIGGLQSWALLIAMAHGDDDEWIKCIGDVCDHLYDAPVVIPAERSEDGGDKEH